MADETETIPTETIPTQETTTATDAVVDALAVETGADAAPDILGDADAADPADAGEGQEAVDGPPEAYDLGAIEGFTLDAEAVELATPVFKEIGLNNEQANKLMPVAAQWAKSIQEKGQQAIMADVMAQRATWASEAENDPEIGGAKWGETKALAAKALDTLGFGKGSPFRALLTDSGLGNHPDMIRAWRRVADAIGEDNSFVRADGAAPIESNPARILYPNNPPKGA